jgi:hypothetical protein
MRKANKARGEIAVKIGGHDLILCANMENLSHLEEALGGMPLSDVIATLNTAKVSVVLAAAEALCVEGDIKAARAEAVGAAPVLSLRQAVFDALAPDTEGKDQPEAAS